ncbi:hypothetical protein I0Q12_06830 [Rhodococcus sp. CX]|nr:hypothetical protein [Rhodococcus sp. CX]
MIVGTAGVKLVVSGVATLALVHPEEMDQSLSSSATAMLQIAAFVIGSLLVAVGILCCVWAQPLSRYVDDPPM